MFLVRYCLGLWSILLVLCNRLVLCLICMSIYSVLCRININCFNCVLCCLWSSYWGVLESIISLLRDLCLWSKNTCLLSLLRNCKWHKYCVISEATGNSHLVSVVEKVVKSQCSQVLLLCTSCWFMNTTGKVSSLSASLWERASNHENTLWRLQNARGESWVFTALDLPHIVPAFF